MENLENNVVNNEVQENTDVEAKEVKTFTQDELNKIVAERIAKNGQPYYCYADAYITLLYLNDEELMSNMEFRWRVKYQIFEQYEKHEQTD